MCEQRVGVSADSVDLLPATLSFVIKRRLGCQSNFIIFHHPLLFNRRQLGRDLFAHGGGGARRSPRLVAASIRPFADLGRGPFRVRKFTICAIAAHLCHFILLGINDGGGHEWALGQAPVAFTESNTAGSSGMRVGR